MRFHLLLIILISFASCKKDELTSEKSVLPGAWTWVYTEYSYGWCQYYPAYHTILPGEDGNSYKVEFLQKGKVEFYKNGKVLKKGRIVFSYFEMVSEKEYIFYFNLDGKKDQPVSGGGNQDTLYISYPYVEDKPDCENYLNFFVRE